MYYLYNTRYGEAAIIIFIYYSPIIINPKNCVLSSRDMTKVEKNKSSSSVHLGCVVIPICFLYVCASLLSMIVVRISILT